MTEHTAHAADGHGDPSARLLREAVESLPNALGVLDAGERLVVANAVLRRWHHLDPQDVPGIAFTEVVRRALPDMRSFDAEPVSETEECARRIAAKLCAAPGRELEAQLRDGSWRVLVCHSSAERAKVLVSTDITARKQAEAALRESEQHFRSIVEGHPLPVWMVDMETARILYESPAAAALAGHEPDSDVARYTTDHIVDLRERDAVNRQLRETGEVRDRELLFKRSDGSELWIGINDRLIQYAGREVSITSMVDLTERKQREAELRQAREMLEDAIESLPEGFALFDADDRLVLCNSRFREFNAASADVLVPGVEWIDFVRTGAERGQYLDAVGDVEAWVRERRLRHSLGSGSAGMRGVEFQQSDGRWYHAFSQATRQGGYVGIRVDVTERKQMELALRESEALIRRVLDACPVPVQMVRAEDGKILYESPATNEMFGEPPGKARDSSLSYYVDPADREPYLAALRERGTVDDYEVRLKRRDGTEFWASVSARMIEYKGESVIVSSAKDLTEELAMEEEMSRQREALNLSEKLSAMGELLAGVAHELNNPLSVVAGQALLLEETVSDPRIAERAKKIGTAADRCARIVKTFLAMARQQPAETRAVSLNEIIEGALEVAGYSLRSSGIDVVLRLARSLPPVPADADQLGQVVMNLVLNAQHALEERDGGRKLTLVTAFDEGAGEVVLKVKDNGPGIRPEHRSRIFEPFFTTKAVGTGTGIGLAICHRIVTSHGGRIKVESSQGAGTVFVIRLPIAAVSAKRGAALSRAGRARRALSVLVVDDEPEVAQLVAEILANDGHDVEVAASGADALGLVDRRDFDVILSDLRMPDLDGSGLYRALVERNRALGERLAFVTGDTMSPKARSFLESVRRPYVEKPITPKDVRELVGRVTGADAGR